MEIPYKVGDEIVCIAPGSSWWNYKDAITVGTVYRCESIDERRGKWFTVVSLDGVIPRNIEGEPLHFLARKFKPVVKDVHKHDFKQYLRGPVNDSYDPLDHTRRLVKPPKEIEHETLGDMLRRMLDESRAAVRHNRRGT